MLQEFVLVSFASFIGWQVFRYFSFFELNVRLAPLFAIAISFGFTFLMTPSILIAFAATGGVAVLNHLTGATAPDPISIPKRQRKPKRETIVPAEVGHRIPIL